MAAVTKQETAELTLAQITRREVDMYAGHTHKAKLYSVLDDEQQTYAVILVEDEPGEDSVWVTLMARVVGDTVVIEADASLNKPLVDALMVNGGVPREKIILAYKGEKLPAAE